MTELTYNLTGYAQEIYNWAVDKGFYEEADEETLTSGLMAMLLGSVPASGLESVRKDEQVALLPVFKVDELSYEQKRACLGLSLIITEVVETFAEVVREDHDKEVEEVADVIIRLLDYAGYRGMDIHSAIEAKMEVNRGRPYKHGKKF